MLYGIRRKLSNGKLLGVCCCMDRMHASVVCCRQRPLEDLLRLLAAESAPKLPPWFVAIDTLTQHLNTTPSRWACKHTVQINQAGIIKVSVPPSECLHRMVWLPQ